MTSKWESVLIEWVNCLKLCAPIETLQNLSNSEFLLRFSKLICDDDGKSDALAPMSHLYKLLNAKYPCIHLKSNTMPDDAENSVVHLLSLLLHYSCIFDQRSALTAPLCRDLSKDAQIAVKNYLQDVTAATVTGTELNRIVERCCQLSTCASQFFLHQQIPQPPTVALQPCDWMSSAAGDSPLSVSISSATASCGSPLQEFLRTPHGGAKRGLASVTAAHTQAHAEREREFKRLNAALDLERIEKADLHDELREHKRKLSSLGQQLKERGREVSRLRSELVHVEHRVTPHKAKGNGNAAAALEQHLRAEVRSYEEYVAQLQAEQEALQVENEKYRKKLSDREHESLAVKDKLFSTELALEQLDARHRLQEQELECVQRNCVELNNLLSELRTSKLSDSLLESDACVGATDTSRGGCGRDALNSSASCEDLACSVIEVQLRESQRENANLKLELDNVLEIGEALKQEVNEVYSRMNQVKVDLRESERFNTVLRRKVDECLEIQSNLEHANAELLETVNNLEVRCGDLVCENDKLNLCLSRSQQVVGDLKKDMLRLSNQQAETAAVNSELVGKLRAEAQLLDKDLKNKINAFNKLLVTKTSIESALHMLGAELNERLNRFSELIGGTTNIATNNDVNSCKIFDSLLDSLVALLEQVANDKTAKTAVIDELEDKLKECGSQKLVDMAYSRTLEENLNEACSKIQAVEIITREYKTRIDDQLSAIDEMSRTIAQLGLLKDLVRKKDAENDELIASNCKLTEDIVQKENEITIRKLNETVLMAFTKELQHINTKLEERSINFEHNNSVDKIDEVRVQDIIANDTYLHDVHKVWTDMERNYLEEVNNIYRNMETLFGQMDHLTIEYNVTKDDCHLKAMEIADLDREKIEIIREYEQYQKDMELQLKIMTSRVANSEEELKSTVDLVALKQSELVAYFSKVEHLEMGKRGLIQEIERLEHNLKQSTEEVSTLQKKCDDRDDVLSVTNQDLLRQKLETEMITVELTNVKSELCVLLKELAELELKIQRTESENAQYTTKQNEIEKKMVDLQNIRSDLLTRNDILQAEHECVLKEIVKNTEDYNEQLKNLTESRNEGRLVIGKLEFQLQSMQDVLDNKTAEHELATSKHVSDIRNLKLQIADLAQDLEQLKITEQSQVEQIRSLNTQLLEAASNFAKSADDYAASKTMDEATKDSLRVNLDSVATKYEDVSLKCENYTSDILHLRETIVTLESAKLKLERDLLQQRDVYKEELDTTIEQHKMECQALNERNLKLNDDLQQLERKLDEEVTGANKLRSDLQAVSLELTASQREFAESEARVADLENQRKTLHSRFDSLTIAYDNAKLESNKINDIKTELEAKLTAAISSQGELQIKIDVLKNSAVLNKENMDTELKLEQLRVAELTKTIELLHSDRSDSDAELKYVSETMLAVIEEDNSRNLQKVETKFNKVLERYDAISINIARLNDRYSIMRQESEQLHAEKDYLENAKQTAQSKYTAATRSPAKQQMILLTKNKDLADLQCELATNANELATLSQNKIDLEKVVAELRVDLNQARQERDILMDSHRRILRETEMNILNAHQNAVEIKEDLLERIRCAESDAIDAKHARASVEMALQGERQALKHAELKLKQESSECARLQSLYMKLKTFVLRLQLRINDSAGQPEVVQTDVDDDDDSYESVFENIEERIVKVFQRKRELTDTINLLRQAKTDVETQLRMRDDELQQVCVQKSQLYEQFALLQSDALLKQKQYERYDALLGEHAELRNRYDQFVAKMQESDEMERVLDAKVQALQHKDAALYNNYMRFCENVAGHRNGIEKLIKDRNVINDMVSTMCDNMAGLQLRAAYVTENTYRSHYEKKDSIQCVVHDLQWQFSRSTKAIYNLCYTLTNIFDSTINAIVLDKPVPWTSLFDNLQVIEQADKLEEIGDLVADVITQIKAYVLPTQKAQVMLKENNMQQKTNSVVQQQVDDWKKKYTSAKQKLTVVENCKNNYERKIQQLREENRKLSALNNSSGSTNLDTDSHYKTLLQQHLQTKEEHEALISECDQKYKQLLQEYDQHCKMVKAKQQHDQQVAEQQQQQQSSSGTATYRIEDIVSLQETSRKLEREVQKMREAYGNAISDKSQLELESATFKKLLEDRNAKISELSVAKEAHDRAKDEHAALVQEVATLKFKRSKDNEELSRLLRQEKEDGDSRSGKRIQEVRTEYELKLERMKEKMIALYKDELNKETVRLMKEKQEMIETIEDLRDQLRRCQAQLRSAENDRVATLDRLRSTQQQIQRMGSRESLGSVQSLHRFHPPTSTAHAYGGGARDSIRSEGGRATAMLMAGPRGSLVAGEERRLSTLPPRCASAMSVANANAGGGGGNVDVIEEIQIRRRTSINSIASMGQNMEMEDESDMFNNKYLADLQEGRCNVLGAESASNRMSELAFRNSMCLPHLKSSYPLETQFANPTMYKDEDIKTGNIDFNDSMSARLLPPEHARHKRKDAGTTSYKKPGPPTPSKNGGRLSLQAGDPHGPLRELHSANNTDKVTADSKTALLVGGIKQRTPNRLRALFRPSSGRNSITSTTGTQPATSSDGTGNAAETQMVSPKGRRLSFFKKPR